MDHAGIVEQQRGPGLDHRETLTGGAVGLEHTGFAALDADPIDQRDGDEVDPIAMSALQALYREMPQPAYTPVGRTR